MGQISPAPPHALSAPRCRDGDGKRGPFKLTLIVIVKLTALVPLGALIGCEKAELDARMSDLCEKDGGVTVYETVRLPSEMFNQNGDPFPGWASRPPEQRLGPLYLYELSHAVLKDGDPLRGEGRLQRFVEKITRRSASTTSRSRTRTFPRSSYT